MNDFLTDLEKERLKERMNRVMLGLVFWFAVFVIYSLIWYITLGDTYNGAIYFGFFMVFWFFGILLTISYLLDVESTEEVIHHRKK